MEYTENLTLINKTPTGETDDVGNVIYTETRNVVLARKNIVGSREFYGALAVGINPTAELQIRNCNYNNETEVEYNGRRYAVIRTLPKGKFDTVLVIGTKQGVN